MDVDPAGGTTPSIVERAKAIILKPKAEWPVIDAETTPSGEIFTRYAVPLAAIGPVATFIGSQLFGLGAFGFSYRPSLMGSLSMAVTGFILALVSLFVVSFIADKLAAKFGGVSSSRNAFKLVAYSMTASWLAGIFNLVPSLGFLAILGLYSFYLFYVGAAPLMKVPAEKALTYTIVTVLCVIVIYLIIGAITATVGRTFGGFGPMSGMGGGTVTTDEGATITLPGVGSIDTGKIEEAARDMEAAQNREAIAPADLQGLLPASIGAYQRTAISSAKAGPSSQAEGTYEADGKRFTLKVADMAMMGAMAGMAGALGVESNREDGDSYERTSTVDDNLVIEKWNSASNSGSFATMVGKRFMIEADGDAASIDELKAAVASIDMGRLAALGG
jgi:Yip1 domain.